ncbi:protoheme IX farnesyltransferase [Geomonas sp. RF6]|uniref:protoheme IX farnesyltransferase n=1 Tax=Geomonas sp. RF6 TaxID=2897342 RepID=UPI001E2A11E3|nr:protoheme IX farnesyltransferase [Geomonas sp. RF6]UFS72162.1 protoheme IX farnesyltransferase [Geomonas sp. RF6]
MIASLCRLFRLRLVLVNAVSATAGYLLLAADPDPATMAALFAGVFLLVSAASALNQVLERDLDSVMERTATRPLPQGEITPAAAMAVSAFCIVGGSLLLFRAGGLLPPLWGGAALAWYLVVYTPLKRRTPFALPLGALCGALPPVIGWCTAGGRSTDFRIVLVGALWYLWQVPHFWLLQGRHREEYREASLPLFDPSSGTVSSLVHCTWIVALMALLLLFPLLGLMPPLAAAGCAALCCLVLANDSRAGRAFRISSFNLLPVLFTAALYLGR